MNLSELLDDVTKPKEFFGFPVVEADWLPANTAAIFSGYGIVIADLESGEIRVVSRESMESFLKNNNCIDFVPKTVRDPMRHKALIACGVLPPYGYRNA